MTKKKLTQEILEKRIALLELKLQEIKAIGSEAIENRLLKIEGQLYASKGMLTSQEAADFMGISISMLYKMTSRLEIPHYKPRGKMVYFDKQELEDWMRKNHFTSRFITQEQNLADNGQEPEEKQH